MKSKCFFCGAEAEHSETQGEFWRFYCDVQCKRYIVSRRAMTRIESSPSLEAEKWRKEVALPQKDGMILFLHVGDDGQLKGDRVTEHSNLWSETHW
jgi:hypothetical protein